MRRLHCVCTRAYTYAACLHACACMCRHWFPVNRWGTPAISPNTQATNAAVTGFLRLTPCVLPCHALTISPSLSLTDLHNQQMSHSPQLYSSIIAMDTDRKVSVDVTLRNKLTSKTQEFHGFRFDTFHCQSLVISLRLCVCLLCTRWAAMSACCFSTMSEGSRWYSLCCLSYK